ncbi:hypothetical protein DN730_09955 [Marinomonas piezotolerans]|uniref:DUF2163 domain-containing protein n=1 Tax=Marinomonas piezotolerans TaxID=2213058 RepID=A0A370UA84_9GAMM|nr:hypothetical protein [Marinomonas piezotolerans]RDL44697.1 hypothetical protein DN730_09955 [Marinomonas piezotolerans]
MIIRNLIKMNFTNGGELAMTDGGVPVQFNGTLYEPDLYLDEDGITEVEESLEITTNDWNVSLNVLSPDDPVLLAFTSHAYLNQRVSYYRQYVWDDGTEQIRKLFEGLMIDFEAIDAEDGYTIQVTASANIVHWQQVRGRTTNSDSQQQLYPNDKGFEFAGTETQDIKWGKS